MWGAPRIHGELLKLDRGSPITVAKYMTRSRATLPRVEDILRNHALGCINARDLPAQM